MTASAAKAIRILMVLGRAHGIRIRYEHECVEWIDTLLRGKSS